MNVRKCKHAFAVIMLFFATIGSSIVYPSVSYADAVFAGGDGSEGNPYQIATTEHLNEVRNNTSKHFILVDDIDLANYNGGEWDPIDGFGATFDGYGYSIFNLTIDHISMSGLQ